MTTAPIKAIPLVSQSEMESAWDVYAALCQYRAQFPHLSDNTYYMGALRKAHDHWAFLLGGGGR